MQFIPIFNWVISVFPGVSGRVEVELSQDYLLVINRGITSRIKYPYALGVAVTIPHGKTPPSRRPNPGRNGGGTEMARHLQPFRKPLRSRRRVVQDLERQLMNATNDLQKEVADE